MDDRKVHNPLGQEIVKALARNAIKTEGLTGAELHDDIRAHTNQSHEPSVLGAQIEVLVRDVFISQETVGRVTRYKLVDDARKVIPAPVLDRDVSRYCAVS